MPSRINQCLNGLSRPRHYSREQWFALILSILCLSADAWAVLRTIQAANSPESSLAVRGPALSIELFALEALLGLAALGLLLFAFSSPPAISHP